MFVCTKAGLLKNSQDRYKSVTFKKKERDKGIISRERTGICQSQDNIDQHEHKKQFQDMKKLRYEIIKFGASGFSGAQKEDANVALLVSLGAERPKNKAKNYKELLKEKKKEKMNSKMDSVNHIPSPLLNKKTKKFRSKRNRKKDVKGLLNVYGEVNKTVKQKKR